MREVADLGPGALDDLAIGVQQQIDLGGERSDVLRKLPADALGLAATDRRDAFLQDPQRPQPEPDRERRRPEQRQGQHEESGAEGVFEIHDLGLNHVGVRGDLHEVAALVARVDLALDHAQRTVAGTRDITAPAVEVASRGAFVEPRQLGREQRARGADVRALAVEAGDLPIPAGKREFELRRDHRRRGRVPLLAGDRDVGDQRFEIDAELIVEIGFGRACVERGKAQARDDEDRRTPERRRQKEPGGDRLRVQRLQHQRSDPRRPRAAVSARPCAAARHRPTPERSRRCSRGRARSG